MLLGDSTILSHAIFWWNIKLQRYGQSHGARSNAGSFSFALHGGYLPSALRGANPWGSPRAPEDNRPLQPHRVALAISMGVFKMKKFKLFAFVTALCAVACQGTVDPGQETPEDEKTDLVGVITLHADKDLIKADGAYASNLTVMLTDSHGVQHDVTSDVEIYCEGQDLPISNPVFTTSEEGEYVFYAMRGFDISNSVTVRSVSSLPASS